MTSLYVVLPRPGVGAARARRPPAVREDLPRRVSRPGLSWLTILRKREHFRAAFRGFDPAIVARFGARDIDAPAGRRRHRASSRQDRVDHQQRRARARPSGRSSARWPPTRGRGSRPKRSGRPRSRGTRCRAMPTTPTSTALSKDLKRRGWSFVGPTTIYAFMQAMGLVNDHVEGCFVRSGSRPRSPSRQPRRRSLLLLDAEAGLRSASRRRCRGRPGERRRRRPGTAPPRWRRRQSAAPTRDCGRRAPAGRPRATRGTRRAAAARGRATSPPRQARTMSATAFDLGVDVRQHGLQHLDLHRHRQTVERRRSARRPFRVRAPDAPPPVARS